MERLGDDGRPVSGRAYRYVAESAEHPIRPTRCLRAIGLPLAVAGLKHGPFTGTVEHLAGQVDLAEPDDVVVGLVADDATGLPYQVAAILSHFEDSLVDAAEAGQQPVHVA